MRHFARAKRWPSCTPWTSPACYPAHMAEIARRYAAAADRGGFDALVVGSGVLQYRFLGRPGTPLRGQPALPPVGPAARLIPGSAGHRRARQADRCWWFIGRTTTGTSRHRCRSPPSPAQFDVRVIGGPGGNRREAPARPGAHRHCSARRTSGDGMLPEAPAQPGGRRDLPALPAGPQDRLGSGLHPGRRPRSRRRATAPHETAFRAGATEYEILGAFLTGCRQTERELPYGAIVALNEHGATLHYQHRDREAPKPRDLHSLLIDAGCACNGYACDITRTYAVPRRRVRRHGG